MSFPTCKEVGKTESLKTQIRLLSFFTHTFRKKSVGKVRKVVVMSHFLLRKAQLGVEKLFTASILGAAGETTLLRAPGLDTFERALLSWCPVRSWSREVATSDPIVNKGPPRESCRCAQWTKVRFFLRHGRALIVLCAVVRVVRVLCHRLSLKCVRYYTQLIFSIRLSRCIALLRREHSLESPDS
jgi:hypothetical protein